MSPKSQVKKHTTKAKPKQDVAIANVFEEEESRPTPRKPVVVEIEGNEAPQTVHSDVLPPPTEISVEPTATRTPPPPEVSAPVSTPPWQTPAVTPVAETTTPVPADANITTPESAAEPVLPSFFEHDLKGTEPLVPAAPVTSETVAAPTDTSAPTLEGALPQAIVSEMGEGGDNKKKWIGITLIIVALLILLVGVFIIYAKKLSSPSGEVRPTPLVTQPETGTKPTPSATPVATQSGTMIATTSAEFKELKKKVKIDVLNGTKIAGLASKQATVLKEQGYVTGRVGNGDAAAAGTIVSASSSAALVQDIQRILSDFTFKVTQDSKATTVVVTLGEPK